eukprot:jgi/Botrbrau1/20718/Bobra.0058s0047.1
MMTRTKKWERRRFWSISVVCQIWSLGIPSMAVGGNNRSETPCSLGTLPGHWVSARGHKDDYPHHIWQVFDQSCQLKDLASFHAAADMGQLPSGSQRPRKVGILMFGDSNDREMAGDYCRFVGANMHPFDIVLDGEGDRAESTCNSRLAKNGLNCLSCVTETLHITREAIWGILPGKKHEDRIGEARERILKGLELYQQERGTYPDMVVLNSNSWDIAQLGLSKAGRDILQREELPQSWLQDWIAAAESLFRLLKELTAGSGTMLVYHTTAYPELKYCSNSSLHRAHMLGRRPHFAQINAAGRHVAQRMGFHVVDLELMLAGYVVPRDYLRDDHHPKPFVLLNLLNIYLNLLARN